MVMVWGIDKAVIFILEIRIMRCKGVDWYPNIS